MTDDHARKLCVLEQAAQGTPFRVPHSDGEVLALLLLEKFVLVVSETPDAFVPALTQAGQRLLLMLESTQSVH